jgi:hypothetical protein
MRSIYKYSITSAEYGVIEGPIVKLLTAEVQHGDVVVWAEVDTSKPNRKFQIIPVGTGWPLDATHNKASVLDTHTYINTVQMAGGSLVLHIYAAEIISTPVKKTEPVKEKKGKVVANFDKNKEVTFPVNNARINPEVLEFFLTK